MEGFHLAHGNISRMLSRSNTSILSYKLIVNPFNPRAYASTWIFIGIHVEKKTKFSSHRYPFPLKFFLTHFVRLLGEIRIVDNAFFQVLLYSYGLWKLLKAIIFIDLNQSIVRNINTCRISRELFQILYSRCLVPRWPCSKYIGTCQVFLWEFEFRSRRRPSRAIRDKIGHVRISSWTV